MKPYLCTNKSVRSAAKRRRRSLWWTSETEGHNEAATSCSFYWLERERGGGGEEQTWMEVYETPSWVGLKDNLKLTINTIRINDVIKTRLIHLTSSSLWTLFFSRMLLPTSTIRSTDKIKEGKTETFWRETLRLSLGAFVWRSCGL